jgi:hypothetical protein
MPWPAQLTRRLGGFGHLGLACDARAVLRAESTHPSAEDVDVKKLLLTVLAATGGALAFKKFKEGKNEEDLWAEATDPVR